MDDQLKQPYQGQLVKFTNVVKGWQTRWFVLNPEHGTLHYFLVSICSYLFNSCLGTDLHTYYLLLCSTVILAQTDML